MLTKIKMVAGTVLGAGLGAGAVALGVATLPVALPAGLVAGGLIDLYRHKRHPAGPLTPAALQTIVAATPNVPHAAIQQAALSAANDPANAAAKALDAAMMKTIVAHVQLMTVYGNEVTMSAVAGVPPPPAPPDLVALLRDRAPQIRAFQVAFNASPVSNTMGKLGVTGKLGGRTAAAMTLYTHRVVAPDAIAAGND